MTYIEFDASHIEAELQLPGLTVQVGHFDWKESQDVMLSHAYTLAMLLSPRHRVSQGTFDTDRAPRSFTDVGDLILVPAGAPMRSRNSEGPIRYVRCFYAPELFYALTGMRERWSLDVLRHCLDIRDTGLHQAMMRIAHEVLAPGLNAETWVEGMAVTVAVDLARYIRAIEPEPEIHSGGLAPWQMQRIAEYVDHHPGLATDSRVLATTCGVSARHLRRLFLQTKKQPLHEYLRDTWVARTKALLCDTDMPLKDISIQMGFAEPSSFTTAFRRATGSTPRSFRQQFAKGGFVAKAPM